MSKKFVFLFTTNFKKFSRFMLHYTVSQKASPTFSTVTCKPPIRFW